MTMKQNLLLCISIVLALGVFSACRNTSARSEYNITAYGAEASETVDNADAIQKAIDACADNGGGSVIFPAGQTFMAGPLHLRSNVNLHFEPLAPARQPRREHIS